MRLKHQAREITGNNEIAFSVEPNAARGSVRIRDRLFYSYLAFSAILLTGQAVAILIPVYTSVPLQEAQRYASYIAFPAAIVASIAAGKGFIGGLRRH